MPGWVDEGVAEYAKRLTRDIRLNIDAVPTGRGRIPLAQRVRQETDGLQQRLDKHPDAIKVALEVKGNKLSTPQLAKKLGQWRDDSRDLCLLIGGPDGLDPALSAACDQRWSLSDLTLPHPLVRLLLAEQIYRGWSLLHNHPYHR